MLVGLLVALLRSTVLEGPIELSRRRLFRLGSWGKVEVLRLRKRMLDVLRLVKLDIGALEQAAPACNASGRLRLRRSGYIVGRHAEEPVSVSSRIFLEWRR